MRRVVAAAFCGFVGMAAPVCARDCTDVARETVEAALDEAADAAAVERRLLGALAMAESNFDMRARSARGALGLLQLMPDTAAEMGVVDACDVRQNAAGGARYLRRMIDQFGNPFLAVAAYNAGPAKVLEHKGVPPFPETVRHVAKVMNLYFGLDRDLGRAGKAAGRGGATRVAASPSGVVSDVFSHVLEVSDEKK